MRFNKDFPTPVAMIASILRHVALNLVNSYVHNDICCLGHMVIVGLENDGI